MPTRSKACNSLQDRDQALSLNIPNCTRLCNEPPTNHFTTSSGQGVLKSTRENSDQGMERRAPNRTLVGTHTYCFFKKTPEIHRHATDLHTITWSLSNRQRPRDILRRIYIQVLERIFTQTKPQLAPGYPHEFGEVRCKAREVSARRANRNWQMVRGCSELYSCS